MTEAVNGGEGGSANGNGGDAPTVESLQAQLNELRTSLEAANGEAAKWKGKHKDALGQIDKIKKSGKTDDGEDYKTLYSDTTEKLNKANERIKTGAIRTALLESLPKVGVKAEFLEAGLKLIDVSKIEYDEETGEVDSTSVTAQTAVLKKSYPSFFESKVQQRDGKSVSQGSSSGKTISREEYNQLVAKNPAAWFAKRKDGFKVVD